MYTRVDLYQGYIIPMRKTYASQDGWSKPRRIYGQMNDGTRSERGTVGDDLACRIAPGGWQRVGGGGAVAHSFYMR